MFFRFVGIRGAWAETVPPRQPKNLTAAFRTSSDRKKKSRLQLRSGIGRRFQFALMYGLNGGSGMLLWKGSQNVQLTSRWSSLGKLLSIDVRACAKPMVKLDLEYFSFIYVVSFLLEKYQRQVSKQLEAAKVDQKMLGALNSSATALRPGKIEV